MLSAVWNSFLAIIGRKLHLNSLLKPVVLHLTVTDRCNLKCRMCNIWKKKAKLDVDEKLIERIASSSCARRIRILDITGGEPFLVNIPDIIGQLKNNKLSLVLITTNGIMTENILRQVEKILLNGKYNLQIGISLDGMQKYHDRVRGIDGVYKRAETTLRKLSELALTESRLNVGIKMTIMPDNVDAILPLYHLSRMYESNFTAKPVAVYGYLENDDMNYIFTETNIEIICDSLQKIINCDIQRIGDTKSFTERIYIAANILFHKKLQDYIKRVGKTAVPPAPCMSTFLSAMVHTDGKCYSCPTLMREAGDVSSYNFDEVWTGTSMNQIRDFIRSDKCACFSQCDQMPSLLFNNKFRIMELIIKSYITMSKARQSCPAYRSSI